MTPELELVEGAAPVTGRDATGDLEAVRSSVARLLAGVGRPPSMLRVSAGEVSVELRWGQPGDDAPVRPSVAPGPRLVEESYVPPQTVLSGELPRTRGTSLFAPAVGVFYRSPGPTAPPFVSVGDIVAAGQQVAIIEAMKLMIPVEADRPGRVVEVLKGDASPVEYGEGLFLIEPIAEG